MTSPVERISGERRMSWPWKRLKGNTDSLTAQYCGPDLLGEFKLLERLAGHDPGGELGQRHTDGLADERHGARGARIDFQHIDRLAFDGVCTFIRPTTFSSRAMAWVYSRMVLMIRCESVWGGSTIAASPEWTPANSMCSRMPPMTMVPWFG